MQEDFYENSVDKWEAINFKIKRKSINYAINKEIKEINKKKYVMI